MSAFGPLAGYPLASPQAVVSGGGAQHETGGASSAVDVAAVGEGASSEDTSEHYSGGASSAVSVAAAGAGTAAEHGTGGAAPVITVLSAGVGLALEIASGGASSVVEVVAAGAGASSEDAGIASPADFWNYLLDNGMTAEQTLVDIHAMLLAGR